MKATFQHEEYSQQVPQESTLGSFLFNILINVDFGTIHTQMPCQWHGKKKIELAKVVNEQEVYKCVVMYIENNNVNYASPHLS